MLLLLLLEYILQAVIDVSTNLLASSRPVRESLPSAVASEKQQVESQQMVAAANDKEAGQSDGVPQTDHVFLVVNLVA